MGDTITMILKMLGTSVWNIFSSFLAPILSPIKSIFSSIGGIFSGVGASNTSGDGLGIFDGIFRGLFGDAPDPFAQNNPRSRSRFHGNEDGNRSENYQIIRQMLLKDGYNEAQACGILANIKHESGFDTRAIGDGGKAHGICQWHPDRRHKIQQETGINISAANVEQQGRALLWELKHTGLDKTLKNTGSSAEAAYVFCTKFERPANMEAEGRSRGRTAEALFARNSRSDNSQNVYASANTNGYDPQAAREKYGANDIRALHPDLQGPVERVLQRLRAQGWDPIIASGMRNQKEQDKKVAQGYSVVRHSEHQRGRAVDIVQRGGGWSGPYADQKHPFWRALREAAMAEGLVSGANFTKEKDNTGPDVAHVQLRPGVSPQMAMAPKPTKPIYQPAGPEPA